jgi:hypothetical protein
MLLIGYLYGITPSASWSRNCACIRLRHTLLRSSFEIDICFPMSLYLRR